MRATITSTLQLYDLDACNTEDSTPNTSQVSINATISLSLISSLCIDTYVQMTLFELEFAQEFSQLHVNRKSCVALYPGHVCCHLILCHNTQTCTHSWDFVMSTKTNTTPYNFHSVLVQAIAKRASMTTLFTLLPDMSCRLLFAHSILPTTMLSPPLLLMVTSSSALAE